MSSHAHKDLIESVGPKLLRERLGLTPQRLNNWKARGIPAASRMQVVRLASEVGVVPPPGFFDTHELSQKVAA